MLIYYKNILPYTVIIKANSKSNMKEETTYEERLQLLLMILAMSAATVLSPITAFADAEEQELNIAIFQVDTEMLTGIRW